MNASAVAATGGVIPIGWVQLALATLFVVFVGVISIRLALGIEKDLAIATVRTYVQLLALGFILRWVFRINSPWLVIGLIVVMVLFAARIIVRRSPDAPPGIFGSAFISMALTGFIVTFAVTGVIVQVQPWYLPQYVIPLAGMVIGNSMTGIALAIERVYADLDAREGELLALTALGATPWEAAHGSIRTALRAGLIPTINSMAAAGLVFIPGMMAGQILAGADPVTATGYQIVVMLMVAAATAMGSVVALLLTYRRRFTSDGVFIEKGFRAERSGRKRKGD
ncbi:MAG: iron export ABC transporter permease subunit FetB [Coriobacteriia bacterium]|nr:iron export ABC transporter permease subunit FetB [Coriobacteriia bacterium]